MNSPFLAASTTYSPQQCCLNLLPLSFYFLSVPHFLLFYFPFTSFFIPIHPWSSSSYCLFFGFTSFFFFALAAFSVLDCSPHFLPPTLAPLHLTFVWFSPLHSHMPAPSPPSQSAPGALISIPLLSSPLTFGLLFFPSFAPFLHHPHSH